MTNSLSDKIKQFVCENVHEEAVKAHSDPFWASLRAAGTELWLDTGDIEEAKKIWTSEMTALTTNNTLLNKEIQKGIYDHFIGEAKKVVKELPLNKQVSEIAFILNARHGLRLVNIFGGYVSVELHTDLAHDIPAIVEYGMRFHEIEPEKFIIKVPYTAAGLIGARKLRENGVRINFTLEFSARQNILVAMITQPAYLNVFLGRIGAFIKDNGLGDGSGAGERAVLSTQNWVTKLTSSRPRPTKLIAASLRGAGQLASLAGVNVYTMPTKVASDGHKTLPASFPPCLAEVYPVPLTDKASKARIDTFWEVDDKVLNLAADLDRDLPADGPALVKRVREAGLGDMFPSLIQEDYNTIMTDGKIPNYNRWASRIATGELAPDTMLNLAGLASFTQDQMALDSRIKKLITA